MKTLIFGVLLLTASFCSAAKLDQSFNDVSGTILSRTGKRVQWNRGTASGLSA